MDRLESPEIASHMSSNDFQQQVQDNGEGAVFSTNGGGTTSELCGRNFNSYLTWDKK